MIIGSGLIAQSFSSYKDDVDVILFASGVSNSSTNDTKEFVREKKLLLDTIECYPNRKFVYFSSCDIVCSDLNERPYYKHKQAMEKIVNENTSTYHIFRLPQVVGRGGNKNTLINFLINHIIESKEFDLFAGTFRNIIDVDDVYKICSYVIDHNLYQNNVVNIINSKYISIEKLVSTIEVVLQKKAKYRKKEVSFKCEYDGAVCQQIAQILSIKFDDAYLANLIRKYYKIS